MTTRPGGRWPQGVLRVVLIAVGAVLGLLILYALVGMLERALDKLPGPLQLLIFATCIVLVFLQRRHFAPDRLERDLKRVRADAASVEAGSPKPSILERFSSWREARDSRFIEKIRHEAAQVGAATDAAVAEALAQLDATLAKQRGAREFNNTMIERALLDVRATVAEHTADVARAVGYVANLCVGVIEHVEANRQQTRELEQAIARLPARYVVPQERVISLPEEEAREHAEEVALEPAEVAHESADEDVPWEVWCLLDDEWIGDVEIIDLTGENGAARYWLRRESDGYIFPRSFAADEIWLPEPAVVPVVS